MGFAFGLGKGLRYKGNIAPYWYTAVRLIEDDGGTIISKKCLGESITSIWDGKKGAYYYYTSADKLITDDGGTIVSETCLYNSVKSIF